MQTFDKRGPTDCWPWLRDASAAPNAKATMACRNPLCCNDRHVVRSAPVAPADEFIPDEALRAQLDDAGVRYRRNATRATLLELVRGLKA